MNQNIWGPHLWFSLHTISFNYPIKPTNNDKQYYKNFFISLENVIPCSVCKKNYIRHLKEHPIDDYLDNRKKLVYWVIDMHNMVNAEIGKKILSYEIVIKKYENVYKKKIILEKTSNKGDDDSTGFSSGQVRFVENNNFKNKIDYTNIIYGFFILFIGLLIINFLYTIFKSNKI